VGDDGKSTRTEGRLDADIAMTVRAALAAAPWTVITPRDHCMAMSPESTTFTTDKQKFTDVAICPSKLLDSPTNDLLTSVRKLLDDAR
jgi:hypothetical protein